MHLYIHIPFCHRICPYCSFYKHTPGNTDQRAFIDAILLEAKKRKTDSTIKTAYLGGGTPSMLSPSNLERLFEGLHKELNLQHLTELTFEANPATFDLKKAQLFSTFGITRVSLGIQSFTPYVLKTLGREHTRQQAIESVQTLHEAKVSEINIDLMFSIPGQSLEDWNETLETAISCNPHHISAYNLTYEEDTAFFERLKSGTYHENEDHDAIHFQTAHERLTQEGFLHYETSNYALTGYESKHNMAYWQGADYLGLGPSSVSTIQQRRNRNVSDTSKYIEMIQSLGHAIEESEELTPEQYSLERIALLLRTTTGVPKRYLERCSQQAIDNTISEDLAEWKNDHLILKNRGAMLVDEVAAYLL